MNMDKMTDMMGSVGSWISSMSTTVTGWVSAIINAVVPSSNDAETRAGFSKWILIILGLYFGSKMLRLGLQIGGKKK